jgi:hypothetical protein
MPHEVLSHPRLQAKGLIYRFRFIPTPVGNIYDPVTKLICNLGSSPRLWGTFLLLFGRFLGERFIPTPVGNILYHNPLSHKGIQ